MTKRLEQLLNVSPIAEMKSAIKETEELDLAIELNAGNIPLDSRIDSALPIITDILNHDKEMDDIAARALNSYQELCDAADNTPAMYSGKLYEVGSTFLRTALDAKDAKLQKKLRIIELQLKKLRIDKVKDESGKEDTSNVKEFDRNALMKFMKETTSEDSND